ncbi:sodium:proton antiporter [soil metagenome]
MHSDIPLIVAGILAGGIAAQWLGWRFSVPAIVFLLAGGIVVGPVTGVLHPDEVFGSVLLPVVSLSVAIILFEGSLGLGIKGVRSAGRAVWLLLTVGAAITLVLTMLLSRWILDLDTRLALLLSSVLVVTGPTVIGPIVRTMGLRGRLGAVLETEGTLIDPIGAVLTVLLFEYYFQEHGTNKTLLVEVGLTFAFGAIIGVAVALLLTLALARFFIPDQLHQMFTLALVIGAFAVSNQVREESGLVAVTVMGITLASQRRVSVGHVLEFNETLRMMLISGLFILLAARIDADTLAALEWRNVALLVALIVVVRPIAVFASTALTTLTTREKIFLALTAPRGIVAAAIASVFSLRLSELGVDGAQELIAATFTVIVGTVLLSGLFSRRLAVRLGLIDDKSNRAVVVLGSNPFTLALAAAMNEYDVPIRIVDLDRRRLATARMAGIGVHSGSVFSESALEDLDLEKAVAFAAATGNDELNAMACSTVAVHMGRRHVFQVVPKREQHRAWWTMPAGTFARPLFGRNITISLLNERVEAGWRVGVTRLTPQFTPAMWREKHEEAVPLMILDKKDNVEFFAADSDRKLRIGDSVVRLAAPD